MNHSSKARLLVILVAAAILGGFFLSRPTIAVQDAQKTAAQPAPGAQSGAQPGAQPAGQKRTMEQVIKDLNATATELRAVGGGPGVLTDAKARADVAPKLIPPMKKMVVLFEEMMAVNPASAGDVAGERWKFIGILSLLGDADSTDRLRKTAEGATDDARHAKNMQAMVRWWQAGKDETAQVKIIDDVRKLAEADPKSEDIIDVVDSMRRDAAGPKARESAEKVVTDVLTSDAAKGLAEQIHTDRKLRGLEGKPLVITGKKHDGADFTSADLKGKVVLVDVWATWCGPCIAELPRVVKTYQQYHPKGFEIIGVSCDRSAEALKTFLAEHKEMPWPQLFDATKPGWHPLATEWGITGIPTMLLIDKKGVVRSVDARENFEELIPKLLEEKAE